MSWIEPIIDRTQADVDYAKANRGSPESHKGARNYRDLQRITGNIHYLSKLLKEYGYISFVPLCKTEWELGEIPTYSEIDKIRVDLVALKDAFVTIPTTPTTPSLPYTSYQKMNEIELIISDTRKLLNNMKAGFIYSDESYAGEDDYI